MVAGSIRHSPVRQSARKGLGAQRQNNNNDNNLVRQEPQGEALVLPVDNFHPADAPPVQVLAPIVQLEQNAQQAQALVQNVQQIQDQQAQVLAHNAQQAPALAQNFDQLPIVQQPQGYVTLENFNNFQNNINQNFQMLMNSMQQLTTNFNNQLANL